MNQTKFHAEFRGATRSVFQLSLYNILGRLDDYSLTVRLEFHWYTCDHFIQHVPFRFINSLLFSFSFLIKLHNRQHEIQLRETVLISIKDNNDQHALLIMLIELM